MFQISWANCKSAADRTSCSNGNHSKLGRDSSTKPRPKRRWPLSKAAALIQQGIFALTLHTSFPMVSWSFAGQTYPAGRIEHFARNGGDHPLEASAADSAGCFAQDRQISPRPSNFTFPSTRAESSRALVVLALCACE